jgi:hypothetical protein
VRWSERCPNCSRYWAWSPMTEQTDDPFALLLDEQWDVEPGDEGDIRDPETVLARMLGLLLAAVPRVDET